VQLQELRSTQDDDDDAGEVDDAEIDNDDDDVKHDDKKELASEEATAGAIMSAEDLAWLTTMNDAQFAFSAEELQDIMQPQAAAAAAAVEQKKKKQKKKSKSKSKKSKKQKQKINKAGLDDDEQSATERWRALVLQRLEAACPGQDAKQSALEHKAHSNQQLAVSLFNAIVDLFTERVRLERLVAVLEQEAQHAKLDELQGRVDDAVLAAAVDDDNIDDDDGDAE
jgi:hypothetical protein